MEIVINEYTEKYETSWLDTHGSVMVDSAAWWIVLHKKPTYENEVIDLIALDGDRIIGVITIEMKSAIMENPSNIYEEFSEELNNCGFVWEFGVHRDYRGHGLGKRLIDEAHKLMDERFDINKSIWYSQEQLAQIYYEKLGMEEITQHWQFSFYPTKEQKSMFKEDSIDCWEIRGSCKIQDFDRVQEKYEIIEDDDTLKPRVCKGYLYKHK